MDKLSWAIVIFFNIFEKAFFINALFFDILQIEFVLY